MKTTRRNFSKGLVAALAVGDIFLTSCTPQRKVEPVKASVIEDEVFRYIDNLNRRSPESFENSQAGTRGRIYHDRTLTVSTGAIPGWPKEGRGDYIMTYPDGDINAGYSGERLISLSCEQNKVRIANNSTVIEYTRTASGWEKNTYDTSRTKTDKPKETEKLEFSEADLARWLSLARQLQKNFPAN